MMREDIPIRLKPVSFIPMVLEGYVITDDAETVFTISESADFELRKSGELVGTYSSIREALQEAWALWYVQPRFDRLTR